MRRHSPSLSLTTLGEIEITIRGKTSKALVDTGATLSVLKPTRIHCPLPQSKQSIQMIGVSNLPIHVFKPAPITFQLGTIIGRHVFLLVKCAPIHLIG